MILMLAPGPNMAFGAMPSGASYRSDQYALIRIDNDSTADQSALQQAGCFTLTPFGGWGGSVFSALSDLYAADSASGLILAGVTGFPRYMAATVSADGANKGTWAKTGTGNGAGNWTQVSTASFYDATEAAAAAEDAVAAAEAAQAAAEEAAAGVVDLIGVWPSVEAGSMRLVDPEGNAGPAFLTKESALTVDLQARLARAEDSLLGRVDSAIPSPVGDFLHIVTGGQSLDTGTGNTNVIISTTPVPGGYKPSVGVRPALDSGSEDPADWGTFVALKEEQSPLYPQLKETPWSGFVTRINERLVDFCGADLTAIGTSMLMTSVGQGGTTIEQLSADPYLARLRNAFVWGKTQAAALTKSYNPIAMTWMHGARNNFEGPEDYYPQMLALWAAAQAKADEQRGFDRPVVFIAFQASEWLNATPYYYGSQNAESFLWIQERNQHGLFAAPNYAFPHAVGDAVGHFSAAGYRAAGAAAADVLFDYLWLGYKRPVLRPRVERLSARELVLHYELRPGARLAIDTSAADAQGDTAIQQHGIRLVPKDNLQPDDDGNVVDKLADPSPPVSIDAVVELSGVNTIKVTAVADIPTGGAYEVRQGWYDCSYRNATHIRDTAGDVLPVFDEAGINRPMHNWAPVCRVAIP